MEPAAIALLAFVLVMIELEAELAWHGPSYAHTPLIIVRLGLIGQLLQQAAFFAVMAGGISIFIWSFKMLAWYQPLMLLVVAFIFVRMVSRPVYLRAVLTSALVPPITALGLVVLQWFTWFA